MPSTYTTNLGIEKIATGEQSGTWGTTTNTNLDLIDEAVNGIVTVTLAGTGTSGSPNTLAISNGSSSDGRNKFIEFNDGGDLGGSAYVQLTPNDAEKIVHIRNSLSGGQTILLFQGTYNASNDFEVPNGKDVLVKFSGAGAGATVTDVYNDLSVTGFTVTSIDIDGGSIDGTNIGVSSAGTGNFSTLSIGGTAITATATELNYNDLTTLGTSEASKVVSADANGDITIAGANYNAVWDKSADTLRFGDSAKLNFGASDDLQIYHDGTNSYIDDQGTGDLNLRAANNFYVYNSAGTATLFRAADGAGNYLYYNNDQKLATETNGVTVTGRATGTLTTDNDLSFDMNASNNFKCTPTSTGALTFTNITSGQSGNIWLDNSAGVVISAASTTYIASADLTTINTAGVYFLSYYSDGTNVLVSATPALTSAGA